MPCLLQVEKTVPGDPNPPGIFASAERIRRQSTPGKEPVMPLNPAVQRCANACNQTFSLERGKGTNGYESQKIARASYVSLMPDVADHDSICDFIACVTFAMVHGILHEPHGPKLLAAAKVALSALRAKNRLSKTSKSAAA
jgi:hypothetical protein